jgi:hypothetical protein
MTKRGVFEVSAHLPEPAQISEEAATLYELVERRLAADGEIDEADAMVLQFASRHKRRTNRHADACAIATAYVQNGMPRTRNARVIRLETRRRELDRWEAESLPDEAA